MIDHISTYVIDFTASKRFYEAVFDPLGYPLNTELVTDWEAAFPTRRCCAFGPGGKPIFWLIETREIVTPRHVAFTASSREDVYAFHRAGLAAGGRDNGQPGLRPVYHEHYFGSFLLDPDNNDVEAVCHQAPDKPPTGASS